MKNQSSAKEVRAVPRRNACPLCGCKELLTEGPDQFCLSCEWDTCAEYVERGLMNNLDLAYREHFPNHSLEMKNNPESPELADVFVESVQEELSQQNIERPA